MNAKKMVFGFVGVSALVAVAGCSTEVPADNDVQASVEESSIETATWHQFECEGASAATLQTATRLVKYVLGDDSFVFPTSPACTAVKSSLDQLRAGFASDTEISNVTRSDYTICGRRSVRWIITDKNALFYNAIPPIEANLNACLGPGVLPYFLPYTSLHSYGSTIYVDPEPATLTANLSSTQGASASAYWTSSLGPTIAKKWNATYGACGTAVAAGEPCSTTALSSGAETDRLVQKNGTLCRCL